MDSHWDDILEKLDRLERDVVRIDELVTSISSEIGQTWSALGQVRADLNNTKKQAATLRVLSPNRQYARAG
jgi:archaellum component FlaC